ncbi:membrane protein [Novosphingobium sediminis]|uniref:Membrane protein n=1 Tax=Novosphingobium sediminis TaxID=707214 RepID=A0A512AEP9_9SPHN|nr:anti-sigma factor [Novosphingobium sediminis]GEN98175.1 membrane protein [Novosphingobium sediminis]
MTQPCQDRELALQAMLDDELDPLAIAALEDHLRSCAGCREAYAKMKELQLLLRGSGLRGTAPARLRHRIEALAGEAALPARQPPRPGIMPWLGGGAIGALAASLALLLAVPQPPEANLADELVSSQIRSLQSGHLVDVETSDRHTVKPWFNGRIDFSPPVVDLAPQGFPLVGGRLDVLEGRTVATLVYRRRLHTINLFIRPQPTGRRDAALARQGYAIEKWSAGGLEYWAVSDIPAGELSNFHRFFAEESRK